MLYGKALLIAAVTAEAVAFAPTSFPGLSLRGAAPACASFPVRSRLVRDAPRRVRVAVQQGLDKEGETAVDTFKKDGKVRVVCCPFHYWKKSWLWLVYVLGCGHRSWAFWRRSSFISRPAPHGMLRRSRCDVKKYYMHTQAKYNITESANRTLLHGRQTNFGQLRRAGLAHDVSEEHKKGPRWKPNDMSFHLIWNVQNRSSPTMNSKIWKPISLFRVHRSHPSVLSFFWVNGEALVYVSPFLCIRVCTYVNTCISKGSACVHMCTVSLSQGHIQKEKI